MRRRVDISAGLSMIVLATVIATAQQGAAGGQWRWHSGDLGSTKDAPLDQINKENVGRLQIAWRRPGVDISIVKRKPNFSFWRGWAEVPRFRQGDWRRPVGDRNARGNDRCSHDLYV